MAYENTTPTELNDYLKDKAERIFALIDAEGEGNGLSEKQNIEAVLYVLKQIWLAEIVEVKTGCPGCLVVGCKCPMLFVRDNDTESKIMFGSTPI